MATWKKILREDLAVGTGLIKYEASSADANTLALTLSDNGSGTDAITLTLGDNLSVASVTAGAATLNVTGLATVATTGAYTDLTGTPTIGNGSITFTDDAYINTTGSFTLNQTGNQAINITHATYSNGSTVSSQTPAFGGTFNVVSSVTYNDGGHITAAQIGTVTLPTPSAAFITSVSDTTGQNGIDLTVSSGVLSAVATNLSTTSNVTFNNLTVSGDLTVQGETTQLNVTTLAVEDKLIKLADVSSPTTTTGSGAGIQVETSATEAEWPELLWSSSAALAGWTLSDHASTSNQDVPISVMKVAAGAPSGEVYGGGSFYYDTTAKILYVDVA